MRQAELSVKTRTPPPTLQNTLQAYLRASPVTTSSSYPASPQVSPNTSYPYSPATLSTTMSPATPTTYPRPFPLDNPQEDRKTSFEGFNSSNYYAHSVSSPQYRNLGPLPLPIPQVHNRGLTDLERYQSGTPESQQWQPTPCGLPPSSPTSG